MYRLKFYTTTNTEITNDKDSGAPLKEPKVGKGHRVTSVGLYQGSTIQPEALLASATVKRYFLDTDIPVLGKKLVIEKLLEHNDFTREQRKEIWKAFWSHSPKVEALRHGAHKEEIKSIRRADEWRRIMNEMKKEVK